MKLKELEKEIVRIKSYKPYLEKIINEYNNIIIIGNGGSNSVASHIAQDYTKMLDKRVISFSDPSRLTCYINDYGRDLAYVEFLRDFADKNTLVILISSSGNSMNIFNSVVYCKSLNIPTILLSGFDKDNKLNTFPDAKLKFFVTAKAEIRAKRRFDEMIVMGENISFSDVLLNLKQRDKEDMNRKINPLRKAKDAVLIDNSQLSLLQQNQFINQVIKSRLL